MSSAQRDKELVAVVSRVVVVCEGMMTRIEKLEQHLLALETAANATVYTGDEGPDDEPAEVTEQDTFQEKIGFEGEV